MAAGKRKSIAGFTLIELLVTIAVVVIMATIAVPNFQSLLSSNRLASDYNSILSSVNYTRSEAVKNRREIKMSLDSVSGSWELKVHYMDGANEVHLRKIESNSSSVNVSGSILTFNALGRLAACNTASVADCKINVGGKNISVNPAGSVNADV